MSRGSVSASGTAQGVVFRHLQLMTTRRFLLPSGYDPSRPNRLRALRLERGLSLDALAQRCVPPTTKGQIEKLEWGPHHVHGVRMDIMWMYRLAAALDCHPSDLLPDLPPTILPLAERDHLERYRELAEPDRGLVESVIEGGVSWYHGAVMSTFWCARY